MPDGALTPGQTTDFTLEIRENEMSVVGFYVTTGGVGTLIAGSGARNTMGNLTHSRPVPLEAGVARVRFGWTAPEEQGGTDFVAYVLAANDNGESSGDRFAVAAFSLAFGCEGVTLYLDIDGDGYGWDATQSIDCEEREGWSATPGDCVDTRDNVYPGAVEVANGRDDDCDGEIDEGIEFALLYPDADGDGFGSSIAKPFEGSIGLEGYTPNSEDCDDGNSLVHPDGIEVCDGFDNDCNGVLDDGDGVFESCGVGACARRLEVCDTECAPGPPGAEICNGLDDDCDGERDEGELCPEGQQCIDFSCRSPPPDAVEAVPESSGPSADPVAADPSSSRDDPGSEPLGSDAASSDAASSDAASQRGAEAENHPLTTGSSGPVLDSAASVGTEPSDGASGEGCVTARPPPRNGLSWAALGLAALLLAVRRRH
jgi:hypothetical protein